MKTNATTSTKKQTVAVKDLKARKNPKGGTLINTSHSNIRHPGVAAGAGYDAPKKR